MKLTDLEVSAEGHRIHAEITREPDPSEYVCGVCGEYSLSILSDDEVVELTCPKCKQFAAFLQTS